MQTHENSIHKNRLLWAGTAVLIASLFLMLTILLEDIQVNLHCQKPQPGKIYCQLHKRKLLKQEDKILASGELKGARLNQNEDENGVFYGIQLETEKGEIPLGMTSPWSGFKNRKVNQINHFLDNPDLTTLDVKQNDAIFFIFQLILWGGTMIVFLHLILSEIFSDFKAKLNYFLNLIKDMEQLS